MMNKNGVKRMKRLIGLLLVLILCLGLAVPAFAAFVPSIGFKDGPAILEATMDGADRKPCLVITSIKAAQEKSTDISQEARDLLLDVYAKLENGTMVLPLGDVSYVVRDLVDVSFAASSCVKEHNHEQWLAKKGNTITITFDLGIDESTMVSVLTYVDGEWVFAKSAVNNGDGTMSVELENIGPVAFAVTDSEVTPPAQEDGFAWWWIIILLVLIAGLIFFLIFWKKRKDEEEEEDENETENN